MTRSKEAGKPFYVYLPYTQVHIPPIPDPEYVGKTKRGNWGDILTQMDDFTGVVLDKLDELGLADDTIVDLGLRQRRRHHLPLPRDRPGSGGSSGTGFSGPWRGGLFTTLEGSNRTPCIVRWPGKVPAGKVSNELVHAVDWYTTLLNVAGAKVPDDRIIDGMDMRDFLLGDAEESGRDIILHLNGNRLQAAKWHQWKVHLFKQDDFYSTWAPLNMPWLLQPRMGPPRGAPGRLPARLGVAPGRSRGGRIPEVAGGRASDQAGNARPVHAAETGRRSRPRRTSRSGRSSSTSPRSSRSTTSSRIPATESSTRPDERRPRRRGARERASGCRRGRRAVRSARLLRRAEAGREDPQAAGQAARRRAGTRSWIEVVVKVNAKRKARVHDPRRTLAGTLTSALTWGIFGLLAGGAGQPRGLGGARRRLRRPVRLLLRAPAHQGRAQAHRRPPARRLLGDRGLRARG